jgi:hypothetical protein
MEFKKTRVKQVLTAIKTVRESFKQLEEEQQYNIKDFYMMSINERLSMIEGYLQSLEKFKLAKSGQGKTIDLISSIAKNKLGTQATQ